jgi:hypothetical protein
MTVFPDAIFVPMPPDVAANRVVQLQPVAAPIVLYGNLHMLNWPHGEPEQRELVSRCADDLLPPDRYTVMQQAYAIDAQCRPPAERPAVDLQDVIKQLPRARVVSVIVLDGATGWGFLYEWKSRTDSRRLGRTMAEGVADYHRRLH